MPGGVINTGTHPKALWPGVHAWWGRDYKDHPKEWVELVDEETSEMHYEEEVKITSFGLAPVKNEGGGIQYDSETQGQVTRYTHITYALGYIVTMEELMDNLYEKVSKTRATALARSHRITEEVICADIYNNAFDTNFAGSDGVPLLSASHPNTTGGTFSNILASAADLSETALEDLIIQMGGMTDDRGLQIAVLPRKLLVHRAQWFNANRILESVFQNDTANNAVNVLKALNSIPEGVCQNHYFDAPNSWFFRSDIPNGMRRFTRMKADLEQDNDFDTRNAKAAAVQRFSVGWSDPLGLFGSEGP